MCGQTGKHCRRPARPKLRVHDVAVLGVGIRADGHLAPSVIAESIAEPPVAFTIKSFPCGREDDVLLAVQQKTGRPAFTGIHPIAYGCLDLDPEG